MTGPATTSVTTTATTPHTGILIPGCFSCVPVEISDECRPDGLAQIIVQSSKQPGTLKLTARAKGLSSATIPIATRAVAVRAALL